MIIKDDGDRNVNPKDYESFSLAHLQWVDEMSGGNDSRRDGRWSESIAVGSIEFAESIKSDMGSMARGRTIRGVKDGFELRESQSGYNADFDPKNCDIAPEKA